MAPETGLLNAVMTGVVTGSIVALGATGLALVYDIAEVPNFAHGDLLTLGAYAALLVNKPNTVPGLELLAPGAQQISIAGSGVLFALSAVGVLGTIYHLGGRDALYGHWWGIDVSERLALTVHIVVAGVIGAIVVLGTPSFGAALLFSVVLLGATVPLLESFIFRKFREKNIELALMLVVSLAVAFIVRFGIQTIFGGSIRFYSVETSVPFLGGEVDLTLAKFFDFFITSEGLFFTLQETRGGTSQQLLAASYGWIELGVILLSLITVAYVALDRRSPAAIIGPRLTAALSSIVIVIIGATAFWGGANGTVPETAFAATRIRISPLRVGIILLAIAMMGGLHYILQATTLGKTMRATSDNRELALVRGINTRRVMMSVWIIAGLFAAVGGIMLGFLFSSITINLGFNLLLPMFAGVILGGISVYGAILGSYVVGLAMEIGIFAIPGLSATYRIPVAFVVLLAVLLLKPEGIVGGS
ncbi:branched-chain amino acid ABC transporter permease [Haloquadratum walsbyi]|jgi:Branched-chain amino acid ABC-type transport system, permease components|uniref:Branched-chain amino acid ABC-type transport system, permease component n=1 Tax=Haloquadratum walsbyi J07HQW2 TaxID=1238425 RepID=U1NDH3_9EURY|nr:branched-chain amino acid ABC transporter permease [Haloquadratum walsbyi]ERG95020.1 MAG: branched-chain amino acid ABC-type transport system, permease component [Haloquadratum walsbyi J07HQW2]